MKSRWASLVLTGLVLVVMGGLLGRLTSRAPSRTPDEQKAEPGAAREAATLAPADTSTASDRRATTVEVPAPNVNSVTSAEVERLIESLDGFERLKFDHWLRQQARAQARPQRRLFEQGDRLSPSFVEGFELSRAEAARLQSALDETRTGIERLTTAYARSGWDEERKNWVIDIPAYPEEGRVLYDELFGEFARVLSREEWEVFQDLFASQLENQFDHLGTRTQRFVVARDATEGINGKRYLQVRQEWQSSDSSGNSTSEIPVEEVARRWPGIVDQLPPEIRRQLSP